MARTANLYRTPPDPGFVGGYNWAGVIAGVALLIAVNIAATQFIAYRFAYQTALGGPLLQVRGTSVYQPFAWASWLLKHGASPNPKVRLPLLGGALIVVVGSALAVALVYGLNIRRAKRLSENAEDLHGSARWASPGDVLATGLLAAKQGAYVGGWCNPHGNRLHYPNTGVTLTRVERQIGGSRVPTEIDTFGKLKRAPEFNPFDKLEFLAAGESEPSIEKYGLNAFLFGKGLRQLVEAEGLHRARAFVNRNSGGHASRIFDTYREFLPAETGIDGSRLFLTYSQSVTKQLAA